tara:strand:+ start:893 stop:1372 length:480 start_codon:yes stop_codon:yes gene_type:complete
MEYLLPGLDSAVKLHPMLVHFPIAFWVAGCVVWCYAALFAKEASWNAGLLLYTAGALTALAAGMAGYLGTWIMGHDAPGHGAVHIHRDLMLWATGLSIVLTGLAWWRLRSGRRWRLGILLLSLIQIVVMAIGADRGAMLVYKMGVGVDTSAPASEHAHE